MRHLLFAGLLLAGVSFGDLNQAVALTFKSDGSVVQKDGTIVKPKSRSATSNEVISAQNKDTDSRLALNFDHLNEIMTFQDAVRFERRVGIGAPIGRLKRYVGLTRGEAIDLIIDELASFEDDIEYPAWVSTSKPFGMAIRGFKDAGVTCGARPMEITLEHAVSKQLLTSRVPQFERLFLFWLDHFSVEMNAYDQRHAFAKHIKIIRSHSAGNFLKFSREALRDPALLIYLNNDKSIPQKPNENLAREFLELFTLGEGNYSEKNIKDLARGLVPHGINFANEDFHYYLHKRAPFPAKAFGGNYKTPDEFVDLLPNHPKFGHFIAKKFYNEYVALGSPTDVELDYMVGSFRDSGFEILKLLEATLKLPYFWSASNKLSLVKSPIELMYGTARSLGWQSDPGSFGWMSNSLKTELNQDLFNPPNVAGWPTGKEWLAGQRLEKRLNFLESRFGSFGEVYESARNYSKQQAKEERLKLESVVESARIQLEKTITVKEEEITKRNNALQEFFTSTTNNQLAVEHIVVDSISSDFSRIKWSEIRVVFYNVLLNEKKWDAIRIKFVSDSAGRNKYGDFIRIDEGYSYPDFSFKGGKRSKSQGGYYRQFSYPSSKRTKTAFVNADAKLLIKRLAEATNLIAGRLHNYPKIIRNKKGRDWLISYSKNVGFTPIESGKPPVKVFAWGQGRDGIKCGADGAAYFKSVVDTLPPIQTRSYLSLPSALRESGVQITDLLIPDLPTELFNGDFIAALTHEGFQLK